MSDKDCGKSTNVTESLRPNKIQRAESSSVCRAAAAESLKKSADSPLHAAVRRGDMLALKQILKIKGTKVNEKSEDGETALHLAVQYPSDDIVKSLLKARASHVVMNVCGENALHLAARHGNPGAVKILLGAKARIDDFSGGMQGGMTALHIALENSRNETAMTLLAAKASTDLATQGKEKAIHVAAKRCGREILQCLLAAGAKVDSKLSDGKTALHIASRNGNVDAVRTLLESSASVNGLSTDGSALHLAAEGGQDSHEEIVLTLIEAKADCLAQLCGEIPLHFAARKGNSKIVTALIQAKADVDAVTNAGSTPLHRAAANCKFDTVKVLLDAKANIAATNHGETMEYFLSKAGISNLDAYLAQQQQSSGRRSLI